jgi:hypothetical protein
VEIPGFGGVSVRTLTPPNPELFTKNPGEPKESTGEKHRKITIIMLK